MTATTPPTQPLTVHLVGGGTSWVDVLSGFIPGLIIALVVVYLGNRYTTKQARAAWSREREQEERRWKAEQRLKVYAEHLIALRQRTQNVAKILDTSNESYTNDQLQAYFDKLDLEMDMRFRTYLVCSDEYSTALELMNAGYDHYLNTWIDTPDAQRPDSAGDDFSGLMRGHTDILIGIARSEVQSLEST